MQQRAHLKRRSENEEKKQQNNIGRMWEIRIFKGRRKKCSTIRWVRENYSQRSEKLHFDNLCVSGQIHTLTHSDLQLLQALKWRTIMSNYQQSLVDWPFSILLSDLILESCVCLLVIDVSTEQTGLWGPIKNINRTYDKAELLVVARVHGLALLDAATVVGLTLRIEGNSPQLKDDVPLSLHIQRWILKACI